MDYQGQEKNLFEKIGQCSNRMKYVYETTIDFVFKEPENGNYTTNVNRKYYAQEKYEDLLQIDPVDVDSGFTKNDGPKSKCHATKDFYKIKCDGTEESSKCQITGSAIKILTCDQLEWNIEGTWTYKYKQEDFMWFSLKYNKEHPDETLMNQQERDEKYSSTDENLFYSIGFGLPTALSLPNGKYGTDVDSPMKVIVSKLGDTGGDQDYDIDPSYIGQKNYHKIDGHFQNLLDAVSTKEGATYGFEYTCTYEVKNDMFGTDCKYDDAGNLMPDSPHYCDDNEDDVPNGRVLGIDVAYRLVGLLNDDDPIFKAFPGRDGSGRLMGSNWQLDDTQLKDTLRSDIYDDKAMYEIFLEVALIQKIRDDNGDVTSGDAYSAFAKDDNVICVGGNDKYCATEFISKLARGQFISGNYMVGTCLGETDTQRRADAHGACNNASYTPLDVDWVR